MKKTLLFALLISTVSAFSQSIEKHSLISVLFDESHTIEQLTQLGVETDHGTHIKGRYLKNFFSEKEIQKIEEAGFRIKVDIEDWYKHFAEKNIKTRTGECTPNSDIKRYPIPSNFKLGTEAGYFSYSEMLENLDEMAAKYPDIITPPAQIGDKFTHEGNPIYWQRISKNAATDENEPEVFYNALHHAREPMSLSQLIYFMWYLLENYGTDQEVTYLLDHTELYFVPCVNPDGYIYNEQSVPGGGGLWRKNRRDNLDGEIGVDLNRNYGHEWGYDDSGSSPSTASETYRGIEPFSEPETQIIKEFCEEHEFVLALNYHAHGDLLIYPWGYSDSPSDDSTTFRTFAAGMARYNNYFAGTGSETVGYTVNGDSDDWMYAAEEIYAMTPEVGTGFWTDEDEIWENCQRTLWMNLATANIPHEFGWAKDISDLTIDDTDGHISFEYNQTGLTPSEMTVSLTGLSPEILTTGMPVVYNLNLNEKAVDSIAYSLSNDVPDDSELQFLLTVSSPFVTWSDTLKKTFSGNRTAIFTDTGDSDDNWLAGDNSWGLDSEFFYSAPTSFGDSPGQDYGRDKNLIFALAEPVDLSDLDDAKLNFQARWDIEANYDYTQILVSVNGSDYTPLCGRYTGIGTRFQDEDQPLWDGQQTDWVEEEINLKDYLGEPQVYIQFRFVSDRFSNGNGFNFDDFSLTTTDSGNSAVTAFAENDFLSVRPNPTTENFILEATENNFSQQDGSVLIFNNLGTQIANYPLQDLIKKGHLIVSTNNWQSGIYFLQIFSEGKRTESKKLVLIR